MTGILLLFGERVSSFYRNDGAVFIFRGNCKRAPPHFSKYSLKANDLQKNEVEYVFYQSKGNENSSFKGCI